jgi:hypothetical protein
MKNKKYLVLLLGLLICLCGITGCGNGGTKISGTVQFSDGTPIDFGNVVFDDGKHSYMGVIKNGKYITGGVKEVEGIPDGTYKIWLAATSQITNEVYKVHNNRKTLVSYDTVERVAEKYRFAEKTDLVFEVKRGGARTFDIVVEKP